ncbi:unnamed protein product [Fraxinus pennsylvanica]|uniref:Fungal lipase-type domain-containing protein n=1 Tax=Fraxinus pennsylvanica TaxID=56036 RepID=A0AAD1Z8W9_9LAMI|nr:unnamed protein product [Fraxinus pennsylvanica]
MSLSIKSVQPCISNATPQIACPPKNSKKNLIMKIQVPNYWENLFIESNINNSSWFRSPNPVKLKERWMDYQGIKNWEGLLDPLDDNLRSEIIRYGNFVEAAYRSFDFEPSSSSYATCRYPKRKLLEETGFSTTGYRVTKNLVATCGIQLPSWIEKATSWMTIRSSWIGYTAVCHDRREISRLGRRDVVLAFRGTATCLEWLENLRATLTPLPSANSEPSECSCPMVESGFLSLYTSSIGNRPSLQRQVREEVSRILKIYDDEPLSITITGHSLGAVLATLAAYDIKKTFDNSPLVTAISFAGPRVGNRSFRSHLDRQGTKVLRIVNSDDLITKVPGFVVDNNDQMTNNSDTRTANISTWIKKFVEDTQWVYADVGSELRLSSRSSPYLNGINITTCHELKTYLHLVNQCKRKTKKTLVNS